MRLRRALALLAALSAVLSIASVSLPGRAGAEPERFTLDNPGFEQNDAWTLTRSAQVFLPSIDVFDPQRPDHIFETLQKLFSG